MPLYEAHPGEQTDSAKIASLFRRRMRRLSAGSQLSDIEQHFIDSYAADSNNMEDALIVSFIIKPSSGVSREDHEAGQDLGLEEEDVEVGEEDRHPLGLFELMKKQVGEQKTSKSIKKV